MNVVGSELANQFGLDRHLDLRCDLSHIERVDLDLDHFHELRLNRGQINRLGGLFLDHTHIFGKREPLRFNKVFHSNRRVCGGVKIAVRGETCQSNNGS